MKKIIKKLSVYLCVVAILFGELPASFSFAANQSDITYSEEEAESNVTWEFDEETGVLTISGSGAMEDYSKKGAPWYEHIANIKEIHIGKDITTIGSCAFYNATNVEKVVFEQLTVSDNNVTVSGNDGTVSGNGETVSGNEGTVSGNDETVSGNTGSESENDSSDETVLTEKSENTGSLKRINAYAFDTLKNLVSIELPDSVEYIGPYAFSSCEKLNSINIPMFWTENVRSGNTYGRIFAGCKALDTIVIPEGKITIPSHAFHYCTYIKTIQIADSVEKIGFRSFAYCERLTSINIPKNWNECLSKNDKTGPDNQGDIFLDCKKLEEINIPEEITVLPYCAFINCNYLKRINILGEVESIPDYAFAGCSRMEEINISNTSNTSSIGYRAFKGCDTLKAIEIPDAVSSIGYQAFLDCTSLNHVTLPKNWKECPSYKEGYSGISYQGRIFENCLNLKSIDFPETITEIYPYSFAYCSGITELNLPSHITKIGDYAFYNCQYLTIAKIPENIEEIGPYSFANCEYINILKFNNKITSIPSNSFKNAKNIQYVFMPGNITSISDDAFSGCNNISSIYYEGTQEDWFSITQFSDNPDKFEDVLVFEALTDFAEPTYFREKSYTRPSTKYPDTYYGGMRGCSGLKALSEEELNDAFFGPNRWNFSVSLPRDTFFTLGFDKAYKCPDTAALLVVTEGYADERLDYYAETASNELIFLGTTYENKNFHILPIGEIDEYIIAIKVVGRDTEGSWPGGDLVNIALIADPSTLEIGDQTETRVTMTRKGESYNLLKEEQGFAVNSDEEVSILVTPDWQGREPGTILLMQGYNELLRNDGGSFVDIKPGKIFTAYDDITLVIVDANNEIVEKTVLKMTVGADYSNRLELDTENVSVIVHESISEVDEVKPSYVLSDGATITCGEETYKTDPRGVAVIPKIDTEYITVSKLGYGTRKITVEQLQTNKNIYLNKTDGYNPIIYAVWIDGTDALTSSVFLEDEKVPVKVELNWDDPSASGKDPIVDEDEGDPNAVSVALTQGIMSIPLGKDETYINFDTNFDLESPVYIRVKSNQTGKVIKKELQINKSPVTEFGFEITDSLSITLPSDFEPEFLAGMEVACDLPEELVPVSFVVKGNKVKVVVGVNTKDEDDINYIVSETKDLMCISQNSAEALTKFKNLKNTVKAKNMPGKLGVECQSSILGYLEGTFDSEGQLHFSSTGLIFGMEASVGMNYPFMAGPIPMYFETEISGAIQSKLELAYDRTTSKISTSGELSGELGASAGVGVGIADILYASGGLTGKFQPKIVLNNKTKPDRFVLTAQLDAYAKVGVLCFEHNPTWVIGKVVLVDEYLYKDGSNGLNANLKEQPYNVLANAYDESVYKLKDLSYASDDVQLYSDKTASVSNAFAGYSANTQTLVNNIYKESTPQYVILEDGKQLAVWLDSASEDPNDVMLYYSFYDGSKWSEAALVCDDNTTDFAPTMIKDGNSVYLAWQDATKSFEFNENSQLGDVAPYFDIAFITFDVETGFSSKQAISYEGLDMMPSICKAEDNIYISWVNNADNDWFGANNKNNIIYVTYDGSTLSQSTTLVSNQNAIGSLKTDYNEGLKAAYVCDVDGNLATIDDKFVFENGARITDSSIPEHGPYYYNHELYWYTDQSVISKNTQKGGIITSHKYEIVEHNGKKVLFFVQNNGLYSSLMASYFDEEKNAFSDAVAISNGSNYIGAFSADNNAMSTNILVNSTAVVGDTSSPAPYGTASLELVSLNSYCDLAITDVYYDANTFHAGSSMEFDVDFINNGTKAVEGITIEVKDESGKVLTTRNSTFILNAGDSMQLTTYYDIPEDVISHKIIISVKPANDTDAVADNNDRLIELSYEDISVENATWGMLVDGKTVIQADVVNRGYSVIKEATVELHKDSLDGEVLASTTVENIEPLDISSVTFDIIADNNTFYYITAQTEIDDKSYNSNDYVYIDFGVEEEVVETYTVTFDSQGGSPVDNITEIVSGTTITLPDDPVRDNYTFLGWYTEPEGKGTLFTDKTIITSSITVYAYWKEAVSITEDLWVHAIPDQIYTGKNLTPEVVVFDGNKRLTKGTDYTVSYKNNKKANDASVSKTAPRAIITFKGNYSGKTNVYFKILPIAITDDTITIEKMVVSYNGKTNKPIPKIKWNNVSLKNKTDFIVQYDKDISYKDVDVYTVKIVGNGNFVGETSTTLSIEKKTLISKVSAKKIANQNYTGGEIEPKVILNNGKLKEGTDYEIVSYSNNVEIGTASVLIRGIGEYTGERVLTFKITGKALSKAKVTNFKSVTYYCGEEITQNTVLTYKIDGKNVALRRGKDYFVTYKNNTKVGTATVIYTGKGLYTGSIKKTFKIKAYNIKNDDSNMIAYDTDIVAVHSKGGSKPDISVYFDGTLLTKGKDYTLSYSKNKAINDASVDKNAPYINVKGKGNFTGSFKVKYKIVQQNIEQLSITAKDIVASTKAGKWKVNPVITDLDGKTLKSGTDYDKNLLYTYVNDTILANGTERKADETVAITDVVPSNTKIKVTVTGIKNYSGKISCIYRVISKDISKAKVTVKDEPFTGKYIEPVPQNVMLGDEELILGTHYEIVDGSYKNNLKYGTASYQIHGIGDTYGGYKTVKFKIIKKKWN